MTEVSNEPNTSALRVQPGTLYADRADGASLFLERLETAPGKWLAKHGVTSQPNSIPVIVMLDSTEDRREYCNTVALEYGEEAPLARIAEAIEALQMAYEALVAAGQVDFIPKVA